MAQFKLDTVFNTKKEAQNYATKLREKGRHARIRKRSGLDPSGKPVKLFGNKRWVWGVYTDKQTWGLFK